MDDFDDLSIEEFSTFDFVEEMNGNLADDEEKDTVRRDETGIPLSNQILYEKLDYTQSKNKKGRNKSHFEIALKQL